MQQIFYKIPFLFELLVSGVYLLLFSSKQVSSMQKVIGPELVDILLSGIVNIIPITIAIVMIGNYLKSKSFDDFLRRYIFSIIVFIPLVIVWGDLEFTFILAAVHLLFSVLSLYDFDSSGKVDGVFKSKIVTKIYFSPAQIVLTSFFLVIILGAFLLMLPPSLNEGQTLSFVDALFMSTSATCVTGLTTISVVDTFSIFGQVVVMLLMQIGGLGIMTLTTSMAILLGKSMAMKDRVILQDLLEISSFEELVTMIVDIIKYAFYIELWGGVLLTVAFVYEGFDFAKALFYGFFHSVSAFCNAGISLFNNSFESFATNPLINITIIILITMGGLGFIVLKELELFSLRKRRFQEFSLHTKIVLTTSIILTVGSYLMIFFGEFLNSLDGYSLFEKGMISMFQAVTLRTAGFNTIPLGSLNSYIIYLMSLFMFIGASPGSTGGGIKTTTIAIIFQSVRSTVKGKRHVGAFGKIFPTYMIVKATAITFISIMLVSVFILLLMNFEPNQPFLTTFFEVISAFGTVGLSLGVTPYLSVAGKLAITLLMYIGRVGPLTLGLAIGKDKSSLGQYTYPDGKMLIG